MKKTNQITVPAAIIFTLTIIVFLIIYLKGTYNEPFNVNANATIAESSSGSTTQNDASRDTTPKVLTETTQKTIKETTTIIPETTTKKASKSINFNAELPYKIKINRALNCVTIYGINAKGKYSIPYKAFVCSVGREYHETPLGTFSISDTYDWRLMVDNSYAQYAVRITGQILFHSIGYYTSGHDSLKYEEYNKLGKDASLGCIRLTCADAKWIYDNCPKGTIVEIYDDQDSPGPLGKPKAKKIPLDSPYKDWDPTDPIKSNPWNIER